MRGSITEMFLHIHSTLVCLSVSVSPLNVLILSGRREGGMVPEQSCPVVRSRGPVMNNMNTIRHGWTLWTLQPVCSACLHADNVLKSREVTTGRS